MVPPKRWILIIHRSRKYLYLQYGGCAAGPIISHNHIERNKIFILLRSSAVLLNGIIAVRWKQQNYGCCCVCLSDPLLLSSDLPRTAYHKPPRISACYSSIKCTVAISILRMQFGFIMQYTSQVIQVFMEGVFTTWLTFSVSIIKPLFTSKPPSFL